MEALFVKNEIEINAPAAKVWDVLTNPEQTKKYMFGCETVSDWKVGDSLEWRGEYEGQPMVYVKGNILNIIPGKLLVYSTIDPNSDIDDIPENYLNVTYELEELGNTTFLKVQQGDYSKVADGENRYKDSSNNGEGWNPILLEIKKISEGLSEPAGS